MPLYSLQTAKRTPSKAVGHTVCAIKLRARDDEKAVRKAKKYPLMHFLDEADFVWLTNARGETIWSLKLKEARYGREDAKPTSAGSGP